MNTGISNLRRSGKVLFSVLIIALLASMVVVALLLLAQEHHYLTIRSATWCSEIPIAEAGVEEAMAHLNSKPARYATNGWAYNGAAGYSKKRVFPEGYFYSTIFTNKPTRVVSIGYGRIPKQTNYTSRTVLALTSRTPPIYGIVGLNGVTIGGSSLINSYNSSDPDYSTGGLYDPTKARDQAGVGTLSTSRPAIITDSAKIYGYAATGPGGTVSGHVGEYAFFSTGGSGIQDGHVSDDFNMAFDTVKIPTPWNGAGRAPKPQGLYGGVLYSMLLTGGDFESSTVKLTGGASVYVAGKVRWWVKGDLRMSGGPEIIMGPGATLELYISGDLDMTGRGVINPTQIPEKCTIYGLPTSQKMKLSGGSNMYLKMYAPSADISMAGNFDFHGAMVGRTIYCDGLAGIHYDEALGGRMGAEYKVISWEEL